VVRDAVVVYRSLYVAAAMTAPVPAPVRLARSLGPLNDTLFDGLRALGFAWMETQSPGLLSATREAWTCELGLHRSGGEALRCCSELAERVAFAGSTSDHFVRGSWATPSTAIYSPGVAGAGLRSDAPSLRRRRQKRTTPQAVSVSIESARPAKAAP
jgi:hypothetical protein